MSGNFSLKAHTLDGLNLLRVSLLVCEILFCSLFLLVAAASEAFPPGLLFLLPTQITFLANPSQSGIM